jgi:catalase
MEQPKTRLRAETFADHYSQARLFFRSQSEIEQAHLASAIVFELSKVTLEPVRSAVLANLGNVDDGLAARVAAGLGVETPPKSKAAVAPSDMELSAALRIIGKYPATLEGRTVGVLTADGADGAILAVAPRVGGVKLKDGKILKVDGQLAGSPSVIFDAVAVVLSQAGCAQLVDEAAAIDFLRDAFGHLKAIGFSPDAQPLLDKAGVKPDAGVVDLSENAADFLEPARVRQWAREPGVRTLA